MFDNIPLINKANSTTVKWLFFCKFIFLFMGPTCFKKKPYIYNELQFRGKKEARSLTESADLNRIVYMIRQLRKAKAAASLRMRFKCKGTCSYLHCTSLLPKSVNYTTTPWTVHTLLITHGRERQKVCTLGRRSFLSPGGQTDSTAPLTSTFLRVWEEALTATTRWTSSPQLAGEWSPQPVTQPRQIRTCEGCGR